MPTYRPTFFSYLLQRKLVVHWLVFSAFFAGVLSIPFSSFWFIPLSVIGLALLLPLTQYTMAIMETTAKGHNEAPVLFRNTVNSDTRGSELLALSIVAIAAHLTTPEAYRIYMDLLLLMIAPAIASFITFGVPFLKAVDPRNIFNFIVAMGGSRYTILRFVSIMSLTVVAYMVDLQSVWTDSIIGHFTIVTVSVLILFAMARTAGILIHYRAAELGINTDYSDEQVNLAEAKAVEVELTGIAKEITADYRRGNKTEANRKLDDHLKRNDYKTEAELYRIFRYDFKDQRPLYRIAGGYIGRLLKTDKDRAWQITLDLWRETQGKLSLAAGALMIELAQAATNREQRTVAAEMLRTFDQRYPNHPRSGEAKLELVLVLCENGELDEARQQWARINQAGQSLDPDKVARCQALIA